RLGRRNLWRDTVTNSRDGLHPEGVRGVVPIGTEHLRRHSGDRNPQVGPFAIQPSESFRRNADNGEWMATDLDAPPDDVVRGAERRAPQAVADDGDRGAVSWHIFVIGERPTERESHAEEVKVVPGNDLYVDIRRIGAVAKRHGRRVKPRNSGERGNAAAERRDRTIGRHGAS